MTTILITGANRGIGLGLAKQLSERGDTVIAACRKPSEALSALNVDVVSGVDVGDDASMETLKAGLGERTVDVLINNAGILSGDRLGELDFEGMRRQFEINTLGPLRVTAALLDRLAEGAKVAIITSRMGSVEDNTSGGYYGYRVSKAGVNMVGRSLSQDLKSRGIAVRLIHPGMVATDMVGGNGIPVAESAAGIIVRIDELDVASTGEFWHQSGERLPW